MRDLSPASLRAAPKLPNTMGPLHTGGESGPGGGSSPGGAWRGGPGPHPACSAIFHKLSLPTLRVQVWPWGFPAWGLMGRGDLRMETVGAQSGGMGG